METRSVRILVVGDSLVGKTSLIHLLSTNIPLSKPLETTTPEASLKLHSLNYILEFLDTPTPKHPDSLVPYYRNFHGLILVYDRSLSKTYHTLWSIIGRVFQAHGTSKEPALVSGG